MPYTNRNINYSPKQLFKMKNENGALQNLSDFDFTVPPSRRMSSRQNESDGYVTLGVKGRTRKTNNSVLCVTGLATRLENELKLDTVSIGTSRFKKGVVVLVFNNERIPHEKVHEYKARQTIVNSQSYVVKIFVSLGVDIPEIPDTSIRIHFDLNEIKGQPHVFMVEPVRIIRWDASGKATSTEFKKKTKEHFEFE